MHPLRETIKISGKRERERGARRPPWWPLPRAHLQFVIRHTQRHRACETPISTFFPTLSVSKHLRFIRIAFERHILSLSSPRLSLVHPFSLFFDHLSFHFSCHFSFLACPCFHLLLLSPFPLSSSILHPRPRVDWRAFEARAENFEKENQRRGRRDVHRHTQPPFLRALRLFTAGAEGTRLRAYVRAKSVSKICTKVAPMGGRREQRRHAAKAKICARSRYVLASIVRNFDGRERKREIDNAIENELNAYQRSNFIFPSSGISITHVY